MDNTVTQMVQALAQTLRELRELANDLSIAWEDVLAAADSTDATPEPQSHHAQSQEN